MKFLATLLLSALASAGLSLAAPHKGWTADLDKALEQAKKDKKSVLIEFTGSDWCPPCMMMRKKVFSKKEFVDGASKDFILVEIDLPESPKSLAKKNQPTVEKYKVSGFPTVVLLDSEGREFSRFTASKYPTVEAFLGALKAAQEKKGLD